MALVSEITPDCEDWGNICFSRGKERQAVFSRNLLNREKSPYLSIVRQPAVEGKALAVDSCTKSHMSFWQMWMVIGGVVGAPPCRKQREKCGTPPRMLLRTNARMIQVRHRSHATYSRQPRQVRKEATVTGSCVRSESPVPGFIFSSGFCPSDYQDLHTLYDSLRKKPLREHQVEVGLATSWLGREENNEQSWYCL